MVKKYAKAALDTATHRLLVVVGSFAATVLLFFLLPVINRIAAGERTDTVVVPIDTAEPPPPDVVEEETVEEEEPEEEEPPPELEEEIEPFDLAQLEMALAADVGGPGLAGDFTIDLSKVTGGAGGIDELFSSSELDGAPRAISQPPPSLSNAEKKATPGKVVLIFIVDKDGRVQSPKVKKTSDPALNAPALRAIQKWRFQPGTKNGEPVSFRSLQEIQFPDMR